MSKRQELSDALKTALKNKDQIAMSTIRLILAAIKDRDINARGQGNDSGIAESDILSLFQSMIKQRQESSKVYAEAGRVDLAEREDAEIKVIEGFLPQQLGEEEVKVQIDKLIKEMGVSNIKDMGRVMAEMKTRFAGQIDMAKASNIVKQKLSA